MDVFFKLVLIVELRTLGVIWFLLILLLFTDFVLFFKDDIISLCTIVFIELGLLALCELLSDVSPPDLT